MSQWGCGNVVVQQLSKYQFAKAISLQHLMFVPAKKHIPWFLLNNIFFHHKPESWISLGLKYTLQAVAKRCPRWSEHIEKSSLPWPYNLCVSGHRVFQPRCSSIGGFVSTIGNASGILSMFSALELATPWLIWSPGKTQHFNRWDLPKKQSQSTNKKYKRKQIKSYLGNSCFHIVYILDSTLTMQWI